MTGYFKPRCLHVVLGMSLIGLFGCQPQPETEQVVIEQSAGTPLLKVSLRELKPAQSMVCEKEGCSRFEFQTVETNLSWINDYFEKRIQQAEPVAFVLKEHVAKNIGGASEAIETVQAEQKNEVPEHIQSLDQRSMKVLYWGQRQHLATFVLKSYQHKTGMEYGLYHHEYVNLDLDIQKRLALHEVLQKGAEVKLLDALYESNILWLSSRGIEKEQLKLSDNFYFGASSLVLVYPLYELGDYDTGMPELKIPYEALKGIIEPEYLTALVLTSP